MKFYKYLAVAMIISAAVGFGFYFGSVLAQIFVSLLPDVEVSYR